ncbi:hypothetical protein AB0M23_03505 [Streptomyces sp. NPDC052077]|uniref:hypothetical protein n=1 Tax=Streptomyces sp. NPDC052077 TaxID=3154757 RepID=UPI003412D3DA
MAGRGRRTSGRAAGAVLLLLVSLVGCGARTPADTVRDEVQRTLNLRAAAVLARDPAVLARSGADAGSANLGALPLATWSYRVTGVERTGGSATAAVDLRYRVEGYDRGDVLARRTVRLRMGEEGRWKVETDRPAAGAPQQPWDQGRVEAVRGAHSLVLGVGRSAGELRGFAALADRAVPAVRDTWDGDWAGRVVVLVPGSLAGMAGLLAAPPSSYRGIAAVTTGETGRSGPGPADRIIVNPEAYELLGDQGRQMVLTHETAHVATRPHTTAATPLWLSEGYADWVGYRGGERSVSGAAPELARAVPAGRLPAALPSDEDFGFTSRTDRLARAYEGGWLACRMIADRWGEERLGAFYRAVGSHDVRPGALEDAMDRILGTTPDAFTERWRAYLRTELG